MGYCTVQDVREEGFDEVGYPTIWIDKRIETATAYIDAFTKQFFVKRTAQTLVLDGTGSPILWLPVPPISSSGITSITIGSTTLTTNEWRLPQATHPDWRYNPKLVRVGSSANDAYNPEASGTPTWYKGVANITVVGDFGFVESDESVPPLIIDVCKRIAIWNMPKLGDADAQRKRDIIQESIQDYAYKLSDAAGVSRVGMFDDPMIDSVLARFRRIDITTA